MDNQPVISTGGICCGSTASLDDFRRGLDKFLVGKLISGLNDWVLPAGMVA